MMCKLREFAVLMIDSLGRSTNRKEVEQVVI